MSLYYAETNTESTKDLFEKRTIYRGAALQLGENNLIDFNWGEKYYYGRVYRDLVPVCLRERTLKSLPYLGTGGKTLQALNFVMDAFKEMALQFDKAASLKNISPNDPYLSTLKAYKAYESPYVQYKTHKQSYFKMIASFCRRNRIHFANFDEFMRELLPLLKQTTQEGKFTFPGFLKSKHCTIMATGLALEVADLPYANDDAKVKSFLESPNWQFYINTCDSYGFMVDLNIPWRIVADLDSELTTELGPPYGMPNIESVFTRGFRSAPIVNLRSFAQDLLALYNQCKVRNYKKPSVRQDCTYYEKIYPTTYTLDTLIKQQGVIQMMKYYLQMRLYEEKPEFTDMQMQKLVSKVVGVGKAQRNYARAVKNFEVVINKEFDKLGSYDYIKRHLDAKADDLFTQGVLEAYQEDSPEILEMLETEAMFNEYLNSGESLVNPSSTSGTSAQAPVFPSYLDSHSAPTEGASTGEDPSSYGVSGGGKAAVRALTEVEEVPDL